MKIFYFADFEIPSRSAAAVHVIQMCAAFAALGHQVTLFTIKSTEKGFPADAFTYYGVRPDFQIWYFRLLRLPGRSWLYGLLSLMQVLLRKPDLVYSRSVIASFTAIWHNKGILELHRPVKDYGFLYNLMFKYLINSSNLFRVIVISARLKEINSNRYPSSKYLVAHDGANLFGHTFGEPIIEIRRGSFNAGYASSFYPGRGLDILQQLACTCPDVTFHLFGGTENDLQHLTKLNVPDNICCYGYVTPSSVKAYLSKMDVLLAPYQPDTLTIGGTCSADYMSPLKIFEYMSVQKPIIASDLPVLREILDETCALLVPCDDLQQWDKALVRVKDTGFANQLATRAYERLVNQYTWQARAALVLTGL